MKKLIIPLLLILLTPMFFNAFPLEILKLKNYD